MSSTALPKLPITLADLPSYVSQHPRKPIAELVEPYRKYEAQLRQLYAQEPDLGVLNDPYINVISVFRDGSADFKVQARDLAAETKEEAEKYIMALPSEQRRRSGSPAIVETFKEFQRNFSIFSESALAELNWDNVVAAGSSVVTSLMPIPKEYNTSKRRLREFYHEKLAPASDVDLFLYGLTEEEATKKIEEIERSVRDVLLTETTTVRTKHAITICSQYPTRHIQIVLRVYKSISEIITGFDVDCSCAAYDGKQVYAAPRALQSYMTQVNHVDLSRRSPSYESRLSKYSHRGFEVYCAGLDRTRIDPTIFERSFQRTLGLARLLVLESLPTPQVRDSYQDTRRMERGRPAVDRSWRRLHSLRDNIKESHEDEVADWVNEEEVSNYHTFTIPYGLKFDAKKIEKLCYTRDLLLNAEWNQPDGRAVYLHRHPAFFGRVSDVVNDCCGSCPVPQTDEEVEIAEKETKIYVSGPISFIKDDPGRQSIGSFNPLTDDDWTEMAYVGNTARLCQAIVDADAEHVEDWLAQDGADPNTRDYTGRTPLHLAVISSTPEIVRLLVDGGARLVARIADGRTALHLAAERGNVDIVKILMDKSVANEAEEEEKKYRRRKANRTQENTLVAEASVQEKDESMDEVPDEEEDGELLEEEGSDDGDSMATGSFVKVRKETEESSSDLVPDDDEDEPDFYDINVLAWDSPCSALHFAIMSGNDEVAKLLCQEYIADILLPVKAKAVDRWNNSQWVLLAPTLALALPREKAKSMIRTLMSLDASSVQADASGFTMFHRFVKENADFLIDILWEVDQRGTSSAVNHVAFNGTPNSYSDGSTETITPLGIAINNGNRDLALKLIDRGALVQLDFETWLKSAKQSPIQDHLKTFEENEGLFRRVTEQPLILALQSLNPEIALDLLDRGVDVNTLTKGAYQRLDKRTYSYHLAHSALDIVEQRLEKLRSYKGETHYSQKPHLVRHMDEYLEKFQPDTWQYWIVSRGITGAKADYQSMVEYYERNEAEYASIPGSTEKKTAVEDMIKTLEKIEKVLVGKGAKRFFELHPDPNHESRGRHNFMGSRWEPTYPDTYTFNFQFSSVADVTETRKAAYIELFEAAWIGDLDKIKKLTLTSWDDEGREAPLKIAVSDPSFNTPFSLAFFRGHYKVARAVLDIVQAQYSPAEAVKARYRMRNDDDENDGETDYESDENSGYDSDVPMIDREIIKDQFTIENVGQVSMKVKSHTLPQDFFNQKCAEARRDGARGLIDTPLAFVIKNNDLSGLKFLLDIGEHFVSQKIDPDVETAKFFTFPSDEFRQAVELGRTELLAEIIKRTGAGLPLEDLVKNTGGEIKEKSKYYQGLTVYGKKRGDWANAGRRTVTKNTVGTSDSPLLIAARASSIESVEWFLSDTPLRHYLSFTQSKRARDDERLKQLGQAAGGFKRAISAWLNNGSELVIHAAILARPSETANELVAYLVEACPATLEAKSQSSDTPLYQAVYCGRLDIVNILLRAGADQSTKDGNWNNLLHAALSLNPKADWLKPVLALLDQDLLPRMLRERNALPHGGRTPIHAWLHGVVSENSRAAYNTEELLDLLRLLLSIDSEAAQHALTQLDSGGNTILHMLVKQNRNPTVNMAVMRILLEFSPRLLFRENSVGLTPVELARDRFVRETVMKMPKTQYDNPILSGDLDTKPPLQFTDENKAGSTKRSPDEAIWDLCSEFLERAQPEERKRRLVSLHEANDVAQRLGEENATSRYGVRRLATDSDDNDESEGVAGKDGRKKNIALVNLTDVFHPWRSAKGPCIEKVGGEPQVCPGCGGTHS